MKNRPRLSTQLLSSAGLTLLLFFVATLAVLRRAQLTLAIREMDQLLTTSATSISSLVSARPAGGLEFDFSSYFLREYERKDSPGFFRIFQKNGSKPIRQSPFAPAIDCDPSHSDASIDRHVRGRTYRVLTHFFRPEPDEPVRDLKPFPIPRLCLVTGIDERPYLKLVSSTLLSTIPIMAGMLVLFFALLSVMVRALTRDLSLISQALTQANFNATRVFPRLPESRTPEVKAVVDKLGELHKEAAEVYQEMWLFLGRAAHQLKTPATALQTTLDVLLRKERSREELIGGLGDVRAAVAQLSQITQRLLSSSRLAYSPSTQETKLEPLELGTYLDGLLRIFLVQAGQKRVRVRIIPSPSVRVLANPPLLSELFANVIENAIRYTYPDTEIAIHWRPEPPGRVRISIEDKGPGVPDSVRAKLFQPFIRGDERVAPGSGLGLSIAKKAAELQDGDLALAKGPEKGARFEILLREDPTS